MTSLFLVLTLLYNYYYFIKSKRGPRCVMHAKHTVLIRCYIQSTIINCELVRSVPHFFHGAV